MSERSLFTWVAPPRLQSVRAYQRHRRALGLAPSSLSSISAAIAAGHISRRCPRHETRCPAGCRDPRGGIDPKQADREWADWSPSKVPTSSSSLREAQARGATLKNRLLEMEIAQKAGTLVSAADMRRAIFLSCRNIRDQFLKLPGRVAGQVSGLSAKEVTAVLRAEVLHILGDMPRALGVPGWKTEPTTDQPSQKVHPGPDLRDRECKAAADQARNPRKEQSR